MADASSEVRKNRGDDQVQLTMRVPKEVHEALKTVAVATNSRINDLVLRALLDFLSDQGRREAVDAFARQAKEQYAVALDKLADL